ncbi:hypothetical protein MML48_2g00012427 [Holotrichia oblita]|uniref:Uncharacterized protein n=1 Tax=Holotrichia oblita TaxID=644536 RepID=A0ACB9TLU1_HOLOL|nr:hypothetical protein MML48_2g00012427 [Holotrichia oblita]
MNMDTVATSSASFSPPKKRKCLDIGHLSVAEKQCVLNMYKQLRTDEPNLKKTVIVSKISNIVGVAQSTVYRTIKEYNETGTVTASKHYAGRPEKHETLNGGCNKKVIDLWCWSSATSDSSKAIKSDQDI